MPGAVVKISFDTWKKQLIRLAKRDKLGHRVPNSDTLFQHFEAKKTAEQAWTEIKAKQTLQLSDEQILFVRLALHTAAAVSRDAGRNQQADEFSNLAEAIEKQVENEGWAEAIEKQVENESKG